MSRALGVWVLLGASVCGACGGAEFSSAEGSSGIASGGNITAAAGTAGSRAGAPDSSAGAVDGGAGGTSLEPSPAGDAGQGGDGVTLPVNECPCAAPRPTCDAGKCVVRGPAMIKAGAFYVDSTEVTIAMYDAFLVASAGGISKQSPECAWNDSFEPGVAQTAAEHPVTSVDFCDAAGYCAWADKQLCGKIGGGTLRLEELSLPTKSQWFAACGGPNARLYPYGASHEAAVCNDDSGSAELEDVGSFAGCNGFYGGAYDLIGNAAEWVNACVSAAGAADGCETTGGSYADSSACTGSSLKHRSEQLPTVGFRCCSHE